MFQTIALLLLYISAHVIETCSSQSVYLYICHFVYLYVCNSDFLKVAKTHVLVNAVKAQHNISRTLDFWMKTLFTIYGVICSPWILLWCIPDSPEDKSASNKSPCNLEVQYNRYVQLLAAKLCSKQATLWSWIQSLASHNNYGTCHADCSSACFTTTCRSSKLFMCMLLLSTHVICLQVGCVWCTMMNLWQCMHVVCAVTVLKWLAEVSTP